MPRGHLDPGMATLHFSDDAEPVRCERAFVAENGWVAVTGPERHPVGYPPHRVDRIEGTDDVYYDTAVLTEEVGSRHVDDGHVRQEPELVRRMVTEVEIH
ncbi:MAG: hypothetical protein ABEJ61_01015 [Haloferacaceae archaeon]